MKQEFLKTKKDITKWLNKYGVEYYTLIKDEKYGYVVEVNNNVILIAEGLSCIPVKFSAISGDFDCSHNRLASLEFSPYTVGGDFSCSHNYIETLEFCPETVMGDFDCCHNKLTSLEYCPHSIEGALSCQYNQLSSLEYFPKSVGKEVYFFGNPGLGVLKNIKDFDTLYQEHLKIVNIKKEKELLDSHVKVEPDAIKDTWPTFKI